MNKSEFIEKWSERFISKLVEVDDTKGRQLFGFFQWCMDNGFFDNVSEEEIEDFISDGYPCDIRLRSHKITVAVVVDEDETIIGIDPTACFDKPTRSSIVMKFPITSKIERNGFYKTLDELVDRKSRKSREWFREAPTMWYGEYMSNWR